MSSQGDATAGSPDAPASRQPARLVGLRGGWLPRLLLGLALVAGLWLITAVSSGAARADDTADRVGHVAVHHGQHRDDVASDHRHDEDTDVPPASAPPAATPAVPAATPDAEDADETA